ncbi:hypothetical protein RR42_s2478 [Cupriavidus basilensis]|uniref:Uncharacterized protein n=1 Tax=Cupriavidus basilensis TaxID=68895 RepID=A0A0C4YNG5_9BURK|nr:hypothetical protein RR42_s2478 [Cupriavidus basilensis]
MIWPFGYPDARLFRVFGIEVVRLLAWAEPASRKKRKASEVEAYRLIVFVRSWSARESAVSFRPLSAWSFTR